MNTRDMYRRDEELWCIIIQYLVVLKGDVSLLHSSQPNIQSCYLTVTSHEHAHVIQSALQSGGNLQKIQLPAVGMSDFYWLNPPFLWTVHTPGFYPGCSYPQFLRSRFPSEMREASGHHSYSLSSHQSREQQKTPLMLPLCTRTFTWLISESFI